MRGEAFLRYIYEEVAYKIAKKSADRLIAKIVAAGTASTNTPSGAVGLPKVTQVLKLLLSRLMLVAVGAIQS